MPNLLYQFFLPFYHVVLKCKKRVTITCLARAKVVFLRGSTKHHQEWLHTYCATWTMALPYEINIIYLFKISFRFILMARMYRKICIPAKRPMFTGMSSKIDEIIMISSYLSFKSATRFVLISGGGFGRLMILYFWVLIVWYMRLSWYVNRLRWHPCRIRLRWIGLVDGQNWCT